MGSHTADWLSWQTWYNKDTKPGSRTSHSGDKKSIMQQLRSEVSEVLLSNKMNVLLLLTPFAIVSKAAGWTEGVTFMLSLLPLCSLAERLGMITEQLAMYTNDTLGGLLNATFGNATEVIIAAFAIKSGLLRMVKLTLLGSIVSNLLLVMGTAFVAGGMFHPMQHFNQQGVQVNTGLLILAVIAIMLPTLLSSTAETVKDTKAELALSRFESVLMLLCYGLFLLFQLVTHRHLYEEPNKSRAPSAAPSVHGTSCAEEPATPNGANTSASESKAQPLELELVEGPTANGNSKADSSSSPFVLRNSSTGDGVPGRSSAPIGYSAVANGGSLQSQRQHVQIAVEVANTEGEKARLVDANSSLQVMEESEEEEELVLSKLGCFFWLTLVTVIISVLSDYIVDAISVASSQLKLPMPFLTTIVVPLVGNAAEHASAVIFAVRNRMEISLGVAVGSSTQVGVLVVPFCVVLAWMMGQPLDLNFNEFEALVLFVSVLLAGLILQDGTSNWLKGALLMVTYIFVAAGFWVHKDGLLQLNIDNSD